ncbi:hypothetical protein AMTRI_Chr09g32290 [Amborella trichopoda]
MTMTMTTAMALKEESLPIRARRKKIPRRSYCFPVCFGFPGDVSEPDNEFYGEKGCVTDGSKPKKKKISVGKKNYDRKCFSFGGKKVAGKNKDPLENGSQNTDTSGGFFCFKFRKSKSGRRTVPEDDAVAEKTTGKLGSHQNTVAIPVIFSPEIVSLEKSLTKEIIDQFTEPSPQTPRKPLSGCQTSPENSFRGRKEAGKVTGKPTTGRKPKRSQTTPNSPGNDTTRRMASCSSFPRLGVQQTANSLPDTSISGKDQAGELDPLLGMFLLVVSFVIMVLWGRLCAIICTSAWLCLIPRLKTAKNSGESTGKSDFRNEKPDTNSKEYKKKVIMDGLLERNHRN